MRELSKVSHIQQLENYIIKTVTYHAGLFINLRSDWQINHFPQCQAEVNKSGYYHATFHRSLTNGDHRPCCKHIGLQPQVRMYIITSIGQYVGANY